MSNTKVTVTFTREECDDDSPDVSYLEQECFAGDGEMDGPARLAAFHRGDWRMIGVRAKATIRIDYLDTHTSLFHELTSPGLWGIESDSGEEYFAEVFKEECAGLRADIEAMAHAEFKS